MTQPLVFAGEMLQPQDSIKIKAATDTDDLGWLEIVLREQFPVDLAGEFDMWFKLTDPSLYISPEKERPPEKSRRVGRLKVKVVLGLKETNEVREVQVINETVGTEEIPEGLPDCPRCAYLEKLIVSMELEIEGRVEIGRLFAGDGEEKQTPVVTTEDTVGDTQETTQRYLSPEEIEIEHLKMVILALNEKMTALQLTKSECEGLKEQLAESGAARERGETAMQDAFEQVKRQVETLGERLREKQEECAGVRSAAAALQTQLSESHMSLSRLQAELLSTTSQLESALSRNQSVSSLVSQNEDLLKRILLEEAESEAFQAKFRSVVDDYRCKSEEWTLEIESRGKELARVRGENDALRASITALKEELDIAKQENLMLKSKSRHLEAERDSLFTQLGKATRRADEVDACERARIALNKELTNWGETHRGKSEEFLQTIARLQQENAKLRSSLAETDAALRRSNSVCEQVGRENTVLKTAVAEQRQVNGRLNDAREAADGVGRRLGVSKESQGRLVSDINFLADSLMSVSERSLEVSRLVPRLKTMLEEKETEVEVLRTMVSDFQKSRPIYVPVKDDPVDFAVASFVNAQKHLSVAFCRQDEGLYLFGTKRVFVKLENGNIVSKR